MSTQLTRAVFRQLAFGQVLHYAGCRAPIRQAWRGARERDTSVTHIQKGQRRTFLVSIFQGKRNAATEPRLDPGMDKLMEHSKRVRLRARLNDPAQVQKALRAFFKYKTFAKVAVTDQQIGPVQQGYDYIRTTDTASLGINSMRQALQALDIGQTHHYTAETGQDGLTPKGRLALTIYLDLLRECHATDHPLSASDLYTCISILCNSGAATKARELLSSDIVDTARLLPSLATSVEAPEKLAEDEAALRLPQSDKKSAWTRILQGLSDQGDEEGIDSTWAMAKSDGFDMQGSPKCTSIMCQFYAQQDRLDQAKEWYQRLAVKKWWYSDLRHAASGFYQCYEALIWACIRKDNLAWGKQLVADILEVQPDKRFLDLVLVWALGSGKGLEEVERMIGVMGKSSGYAADIDTINGLISMALWRKDAYMAERVSHMAEKSGLSLDSQTFIMQMKYRLDIGDTAGALGAYGRMQRETMTEEGQANDIVNRLIRAMCESRRHDFESIMDVAADMTDQNMRFEAQTVSTLAVLHLSRGEVEDAEDLLNTYSYSCSIAERREILEAILKTCLSKETRTNVLWATYEILKKTFDDMNREQRTRVMMELFMRSEGELAMQVFEHMRLHTRDDTVPTVDTYVSCLIGIEVLSDDDCFGKLYNLLKLDTTIEPNTKLHNALMSTSISCGMMQRALSFWDVIATSDEGPDLRSIRLSMKACESAPGGDVKALQIHIRLEQSGFEVQAGYLAWLLGALGGNGKIHEALTLAEQYNQDRGIRPTVTMIGNLINASTNPTEQQQALEWAESQYPDLATQLKNREVTADTFGRRRFNVFEKRDA